MFLICASLHPRINLNVLRIFLLSEHSSPVQAIIPAEQLCSSINKFPNDAFIGPSMHHKHIISFEKVQIRKERKSRKPSECTWGWSALLRSVRGDRISGPHVPSPAPAPVLSEWIFPFPTALLPLALSEPESKTDHSAGDSARAGFGHSSGTAMTRSSLWTRTGTVLAPSLNEKLYSHWLAKLPAGKKELF